MNVLPNKLHNKIANLVVLNLQDTFVLFVIFLMTTILQKKFFIVTDVVFVELVEGKTFFIAIRVIAVFLILK
jgi:hypothetical protein